MFEYKHRRCIKVYLWDGEYWYPDFIVKILWI